MLRSVQKGADATFPETRGVQRREIGGPQKHANYATSFDSQIGENIRTKPTRIQIIPAACAPKCSFDNRVKKAVIALTSSATAAAGFCCA